MFRNPFSPRESGLILKIAHDGKEISLRGCLNTKDVFKNKIATFGALEFSNIHFLN